MPKPSMGPSVTVTIRLRREDRESIQAICREMKITFSEFARRAVEWLDVQPPPINYDESLAGENGELSIMVIVPNALIRKVDRARLLAESILHRTVSRAEHFRRAIFGYAQSTVA